MISRRRVSLALAALFTSAAYPIRGNSASPIPDFAKPKDVLKAFVKLRGSLKSELVIWSFEGRAFGVVDQKVLPLWGLQTAKFEHFERIDDAAFAVKSLELTYPFDLATNKRITKAVNPYTDQEIELGYGKFGPNELLLTEAGFEIPPARSEGFPGTLESALGSLRVHADDIWLSEDTFLEIPAMRDGGRALNASDVNTYKGLMSEVADDNVASANATMSYNVILSWHAWMDMAGQSGHMMRRMAGKKLFSLDALPESFLSVAEREHPDIINNAAQLVGLR